MSINIRAIKIMIDTNIPGKKPVPLTKSVLYNPELKNTNNFEEYPLFTADVVYPESYLNTLSYEKRLEFFFNKPVMDKILRTMNKEFVKSISQNSVGPKNTILTPEDQRGKKQDMAAENTKKLLKEKLKQLNNQAKTIDTKYKDLKSQKEYVEWSKFIQTNENMNSSILYNISDGFTVRGPDQQNIPFKLKDTSRITTIDQYIKEKARLYAKDMNDMIDLLKDILENRTITDLFKKSPNDQTKNAIPLKTLKNKMNEYLENIKTTFKEYSTYYPSITILPKKILDEIEKLSKGTISNSTLDEKKRSLETLNKELIAAFLAFIKDAIDTISVGQIDEFFKQTPDIIAGYITDLKNRKKTLDTKISKQQEELDKQSQQEKQIIDTDAKKINEEIDAINKSSPESTMNADSIKTIIKEQTDKTKIQSENSEKNIHMMLRMFFPTKYPFVNNYFSSFNSIVMGNPETFFSLSNIIPSFLRKKMTVGTTEYSYIKLDNKVYTITQVIWLNDIYNNIEYRKLVNEFQALSKWKYIQETKLVVDINNRISRFKETYGDYGQFNFQDSDIEYLKKQVDEKKLAELQQNSRSYSNSVDKYISYKNLVNQLVDTIEKFNDYLKVNESDDIMIDAATNVIALYREITSKYDASYFKKVDKYEKTVKSMEKDLKDIKINKYILDNYIGKPGINLDYQREDNPEYKNILTSKYKQYTDFAEMIQKYRAPQRESLNQALQTTITDFLDNREKYKGIFNFVINPLNMRMNPFDTMPFADDDDKNNYVNRMKTGVSFLPSSEPNYEIYIYLNVIGGELNDLNKSSIDCLYKGDSLGGKFEYLLNETLYNQWDINSASMYFDITEGAAKQKVETAKAEKAKEAKEAKEANQTLLKQGGNNFHNTRKHRENFIRNCSMSKTRKQMI